jgi:hypothetical protein
MEAAALLPYLAVFAAVALAYPFWCPDGMMRAAGLALVGTIAAPFVLGFLLSPLIGSGGGLGFVLVFGVLALVVACAAIFAALGAAARHDWKAAARLSSNRS